MQTPLTLTGTVSLFAGSPTGVSGYTNGTGTASLLQSPKGITTDGTNLYVADETGNQIRKIVIATGAVTLFAGSPLGGSGRTNGIATVALFNCPTAITTDGTNLYVAECAAGNNDIRQISLASGNVTLLAGSPTGATGMTNGSGTTALFNNPNGITTDGTNLYVADFSNNQIRQVVIASGAVTLLAGSLTGAPGLTNGTGSAAQFFNPAHLTVNGGNLYVTDEGNNEIRMINISTGAVTLFAGSTAGLPGMTNGTGTAALFHTPMGITTDGTNLYVVDYLNNQVRQIVIATGAVTLLTGNPAGAAGSTNGTAAVAAFNGPFGITSDGTSLYLTDWGNNEVRKIQ